MNGHNINQLEEDVVGKTRIERDKLLAENARLKSLLKSIDEEPPDPTLKYLEEKLSTKGEYSLCETIDNTVFKIGELTKENSRLKSELETLRKYVEKESSNQGYPHLMRRAYVDILNRLPK